MIDNLYFFRGLPAIIDLAAMRDAFCQRGVDPEIVNLKCQVDVILDSSPPIDISSKSVIEFYFLCVTYIWLEF